MRANLKFRRGSVPFEALVVATTAAITATVTYKIATDRVAKQFEERINKELEDTRKFFAALQEKPALDELVPVESLAAEDGWEDRGDGVKVNTKMLEPEVQVVDPRPPLGGTGGDGGALVAYNRLAGNYDGGADHTPGEIEEDQKQAPTVRSIFREVPVTDHLPQEMIDVRDEATPYIITAEEYSEGESNGETFTYYAGDSVLADENQDPVDDIRGTVGTEALDHFGLGSGDSRIVYVRNERIGIDFEIILHDGSYGEVVHGIPPTVPSRSAQEE